MIYGLISHKHSFLLFAGHFTAVAGNALTPPSPVSDHNFTLVFCWGLGFLFFEQKPFSDV